MAFYSRIAAYNIVTDCCYFDKSAGDFWLKRYEEDYPENDHGSRASDDGLVRRFDDGGRLRDWLMRGLRVGFLTIIFMGY